MSETSIRAKRIWTGSRMLRDGAIHIADGFVRELEEPATSADRDYGDALIVPGFCNAHSHMEYSVLRGLIPPTGDFLGWILKVIQHRKETPEEAYQSAAAKGVAEAIAAGTTTLLDIVTRGSAEAALRAGGMRVIAFLEAIRPDLEQARAGFDRWRDRFEALETNDLLRKAISPHAPYSMSGPFAGRVADYARANDSFLAVHLAETELEVEMCREGTGAMAETFGPITLPDGSPATGLSPVQWADECGLLGPKTLAIHCNYLSDGDIALLAARGVSVAFCPGTHDYFRHKPHPLTRLREAGINVCVGTDSAGSNTGLSPLEELCRAKRKFPDLGAERIFAMIGANVGRYLRMEERIGSLEPGAFADFAVLKPCPESNELEAVLDGSVVRVLATAVGGKPIHGAI